MFKPPEYLNLSTWLDALAADLCIRIPEFQHIETERVLFTMSRSRAQGTHGLHARIFPMRFASGERQTTRRRRGYLETWQMPLLRHDGRDILYLVTILFPRFLRLGVNEKLNTIIHELYHISPQFNGDIRRFSGRNFAHGSPNFFRHKVQNLLSSYLEASPESDLLHPLHLTEEDWNEGRIRLTGLQVSLPKAQLIARRRS